MERRKELKRDAPGAGLVGETNWRKVEVEVDIVVRLTIAYEGHSAGVPLQMLSAKKNLEERLW
jgi:hypothetical protein